MLKVLSRYFPKARYMSSPLCQNKCTLERGGDHCLTCGQTPRERYQWHELTEEEKSEAIERLKDYEAK